MKTFRIASFALAIAGLLASGPVFANEGHEKENAAASTSKGQLVPASQVDASWLAKARADYPLDTCVISGDPLKGDDSMGEPLDYVYREEGKPDRLVRFCCKHCPPDFKKEPEKYLKEIENARDKKAAG